MDGLPIAAIQPAAATISALHTDNIGTVQRATNAAKTVVWTCNYSPFGACTPTTTITMISASPARSPTRPASITSGFRDEARSFGRGCSPIRLGLRASFPGYPVATVNGYPYALNNPITNTDPSGLQWQVVTLALLLMPR